MTLSISFFKRLYKRFSLEMESIKKSSLRTKRSNPERSKSPGLFRPLRGLTMTGLSTFCLAIFFFSPLHALSPSQELNACKSALLTQINEQKRLATQGCPVGEKLLYWLGIYRNPEQFTPQELMAFLDSHSHWPQHKKLCQKAEEVLILASDADVIAWFEKHPPQTAGGVLTYAKLLLAENQKKKAVNLIKTTWQSMEMTKAEEQKFLKAFSPYLSTEDYVARLDFLLWEEKEQDAKRLMAYVPASAQKTANVRLAFQSNKEDALQRMAALPQELQQNEGVLYEAARWHRNRKEFAEAAQILLQTFNDRTHAEKWWKERSYIAREWIALRDYEAAYEVAYNHNLKPGNEKYADAEWLLGWLALRFIEDPKAAEQHFTALSSNVEGAISKARGGYWMGRTYEAQNNIPLAEKWYRKAARYKTTYYGQLAAAKLQEAPYPTLAKVSQATAEERKRFANKDLVKAAHILKGLGAPAKYELAKILSHIATHASTKGERELAVHLAHDLSPHDVVWTAKKAGHKEPVHLCKAFPVCSIPQKGQVLPEKAFVLAIAYRESDFNPKAHSPADARGLLQLVPKTAADEAKSLGVPHHDDKLFEPSHNLLLGSSYLSRVLNDYNHSYVLASAAYNAGPGRVDRWLKEYGNPHAGEVDIVDWVELIPFAETRAYVMGVLANTTNYRSLEGQPKKTLVDDLRSGRSL